MKTLIIYDNAGYIIQNVNGEYRKPEGIPFLEVEVPEGKRIDFNAGVNVEVNPHQVILEDVPPSEIERLRIEQAQSNAELIQLIMMMGGGME